MSTGSPIGGVSASGTFTILLSPGLIASRVSSSAIGSPSAAAISTTTTTSSSGCSPWFAISMSNETSSVAGICAVAPSTSAVPAGVTVTLPRPVPWSPGSAASSPAVPIPASLSATVCGRSQLMSGRKAIVSGSRSVSGTGTSSSRFSSSISPSSLGR